VQSRAEKRWLWGLLLAVVAVGLTAVVFYWLDRTYYQRKANAMEWRWSHDQASLDYCMKNNLRGYTVTVQEVLRDGKCCFGDRQISVLDGGEVVFTYDGDVHTVFVQIKDVLYLADHPLFGKECKLIAYDLKARKELWARPLRGYPRDPADLRLYHHHRWFSPRITIEVDDGAILVFGQDWGGRYIEYVDPRDGKTIGHKAIYVE
jgi:hypothetical protein